MDIRETDLPGVGKKHELEIDGGKRLVIVTHNTGRREVYLKPDPDADSRRLFELSDRMARTVGTILEGAYFQPVQSDRAETLLTDNVHIEWYTVSATSELAGVTLDESNLRDRTGASIVAIEREGDVISPPGPDDTLEAGDVVVLIGDESSCAACGDLLTESDE